MKAVDVALTWPYSRATRLAAAGASYGGYMATAIEGHNPVPHHCQPRWSVESRRDDVLHGFRRLEHVGAEGPRLGQPAAAHKSGPKHVTKNFVTPMLIIHGERDYRVNLSQGIAMFQALQEKRVPSKLLLFEDENHWVLKPADNILWYQTVLAWLDEWVKPDRADYETRMRGGTPRCTERVWVNTRTNSSPR